VSDRKGIEREVLRLQADRAGLVKHLRGYLASSLEDVRRADAWLRGFRAAVHDILRQMGETA